MNCFLRRSVTRFSLCCIAVIFCTYQIAAQQTLGSLNGTVVDATGAAIIGATVTVTDEAINVTQATTTSKTGFFQIFNLPVGTYSVKATHDGFDTTVASGIAVREASASTINISLKIGKASESVEVTANPMLNAK